MWECVRDKVIELGGEVISNHKVNKIEIDDEKRVRSISAIDNSTGNTVSFMSDYCISTMPVDELINAFDCEIPKEVKNVSDNLLFRDFITVGVLLKKMNASLDDNWIYIQEPSVKVGRIQISKLDENFTSPRFEMYLQLTSDLGDSPIPAALPTFSDGPHYAYSFQWSFFVLLILGGRILIGREELRSKLSSVQL